MSVAAWAWAAFVAFVVAMLGGASHCRSMIISGLRSWLSVLWCCRKAGCSAFARSPQASWSPPHSC